MSPNFDANSILENIGNKSAQLEKEFVKIDEALDDVERDRIIENIALSTALSDINGNLFEIISQRAINACASTKEYNYDLYINHLLRAIGENLESLVSVRGSENIFDISYKVDFNPLGEIDEWANAVEAVRSAMGWGLTKGQPTPEWYNGDANDLASKMWAEKIYAVDREGGRVFKTITSKTKKGKTTTKQEDVTDKYRGKYRETIQLRLNAISASHAPFWYIINFGNQNLGFGEGTPYPTVAPTNFITDIEITLKGLLQVAYNSYYNQAIEYVKKRFDDIYNFLLTSQRGIKPDMPRLEKKAKEVVLGEVPIIEGKNRVEQLRESVETITYWRRGRQYTQLRYIKSKKYF